MLFNWFNWFKPKEKRNNDVPYLYGNPTLKIQQIFGGNSAITLSAVFNAIELISGSIAQLPINVKRTGENGEKEIQADHPVSLALKSGLLTQYMLIKQMIKDMYLNGNGYAKIVRSKNAVSDIVYLPAQDVQINYNKTTGDLYYSYMGKKILPKDIIHIYKNSSDGITGQSITALASRTITLANTTENQALSWFQSGSSLTGIISVKGPSDEEQRDEIASKFHQTYGMNSVSSGTVAVFPNDLEYQTILANAADSQLLESRLYNVTEIARWFNISPVLLQDLSHSSYSTIEATNIQFLTQTLQPVIRLIEQEFCRKLINEHESHIFTIDFDETFLLKSDKSSTASYYTNLVTNGILTRNEARAALGYSAVDGGDKLLVAYTDINQNTINNQEEQINTVNDDDNNE